MLVARPERARHRRLCELTQVPYRLGCPIWPRLFRVFGGKVATLSVDLGPNVAIAVFLNEGCVHPLNGTGTKFPMHKMGVDVSMTPQNPNAFMRFTTAPHDWDTGIASKNAPDGSFECGDLDARADSHDGWPGHVVTVFVR